LLIDFEGCGREEDNIFYISSVLDDMGFKATKATKEINS
jgi:hypothetical protein